MCNVLRVMKYIPRADKNASDYTLHGMYAHIFVILPEA